MLPLVTIRSVLAVLLLLFPLPDIVYTAKDVSSSNHHQTLSAHVIHERTAQAYSSSIADKHAHTVTTITHTHRRHRLERRIQADDFNTYVCKGDVLLGMILHGEPLKHHWGPGDLQNGWTKRGYQGDVMEYRTPEDLAPILEELGIPHGDFDIHLQQWYQDRPFTDSSGYANTPATGGHYHNDFIPNGNAILAESNYSPRFQAGPNAEVPPLWRWSDIVWLLWIGEKGEEKAKELRYIFRCNINTNSTRQVMEYMVGASKDRLNLPWPGRGFDMSTREGKALLATPHGVGLAYLIADHSDILGRKIPYAHVFTLDLSESGSDSESEVEPEPDFYYILWELRDTISGNLSS